MDPGRIWGALAAVAVAYIAIETIIRRRVLQTLLDLTLILAGIAVVVLVATSLVLVLALVVLAVGLVILRDNLRELRSSIG